MIREYKEYKIDNDCLLTKVCKKYYKDNFDNNCEELIVLRWFRDNFISEKDIEYYYKISPIIIKLIEKVENSDEIFNNNYDLAYSKYKNTIMQLEQELKIQSLKQTIKK